MPMRAVRSGCEEGVEWVEEEDAMMHLLTEGLNGERMPEDEWKVWG